MSCPAAETMSRLGPFSSGVLYLLALVQDEKLRVIVLEDLHDFPALVPLNNRIVVQDQEPKNVSLAVISWPVDPS
jgi:hypothetical protein